MWRRPKNQRRVVTPICLASQVVVPGSSSGLADRFLSFFHTPVVVVKLDRSGEVRRNDGSDSSVGHLRRWLILMSGCRESNVGVIDCEDLNLVMFMVVKDG